MPSVSQHTGWSLLGTIFARSTHSPLHIKCDNGMKTKGSALVLKWSAPSVNMFSRSDTCQCPDSRGAIAWPALPPAWIFINMCHLLCWRLCTLATGGTIGSDHSSRFTSAGQRALTADQFLSAGTCNYISHSTSPHAEMAGIQLTKGNQDR